MEAVVHGDDVEGAPVVAGAPLAGELDRAFVGLGAAVAEEHLPEARGVGEQARQTRHLGVVVRRAAVDQPRGLEGDGLHDHRRAVAEAIYGPALHEVEVGLALLVLEPGAVALHHDDGWPVRHLHDRAEIGAHVVVLSTTAGLTTAGLAMPGATAPSP